MLFNRERLFVTSPEAIKELLVTKSYNFVKNDLPTFLFRTLLGNGLLIAEGDEHKRQRKGLMPAFSFRHVKDLYPIFWAKGRQVTNAIARASENGAPQSTKMWASRVTLDIIGLAGMGHDFNSIDDPDTEINQTYNKLFAEEPPFFYWLSIGFNAPIKWVFALPLPMIKLIRKSAASMLVFKIIVTTEIDDS